MWRRLVWFEIDFYELDTSIIATTDLYAKTFHGQLSCTISDQQRRRRAQYETQALSTTDNLALPLRRSLSTSKDVGKEPPWREGFELKAVWEIRALTLNVEHVIALASILPEKVRIEWNYGH